MSNKYLVLGNDKRQEYIYFLLKAEGDFVIYESANNISKGACRANDSIRYGDYDVIVLPLNNSTSYFDKIKKYLKPNQILVGGKLEIDREKYPDIKYFNCLKAPGLAYRNAIATAEGAIAAAITHSDCILQGSNCLIWGFGKCGEILAQKLCALKGDITVIECDLEKIGKSKAYGYRTVNPECVKCNQNIYVEARFIFNTVPDIVLNSVALKALSKNVLIIDIASNPGGVDYDFCGKNNINVRHELGIPARYAPETAASYIVEEIRKFIAEGK